MAEMANHPITLIEFLHLHWFWALWFFWGSFGLAFAAVRLVGVSWNRWLRSRNIRSQGWPPPHLDADGDFQKKEPVDG